MDINIAAVIVVIIFAIVAIAAFLRFRGGGTASLKGPFGTQLDVGGSNHPPGPAGGISARDLKSRSGGITLDEGTGWGIEASKLEAEKDIRLKTSPASSGNDPKAPPPATPGGK